VDGAEDAHGEENAKDNEDEQQRQQQKGILKAELNDGHDGKLLEEERKKQFDDTPFPTFLEVLDKVGKSAYFWPSVGAEGEAGGVEAHTRGVFEELTKTP
jgi:hypothetical protein